VLDKALDLPDVDWLIRSETPSDEAFDIEVTGGWVIVPLLSCYSLTHLCKFRSVVLHCMSTLL